MGAANIALKSTIKNIDDFLIEPMIESLFHFNMEFGTNEKSKGDLRIVARGSTSLVQKEIQSQRLLQFLSIVGDNAGGVVKQNDLLREIASSMDIDPNKIMKTEEQMALEQQQQQQQQQQLLQAQMQQAASAGGPPPQGDAGMGAPVGFN